jgi:hypothetical protein
MNHFLKHLLFISLAIGVSAIAQEPGGTRLRATGQLSLSKYQEKGGRDPAIIAVKTSEATMDPMDSYNIISTSASKNHNGSMPIGGGQTKGAGIPFKDQLDKANVKLAKMQNGQHESLMLGNGDLYGIVWQKQGELFMRITKSDIWDARIDTSKDGPLPKVDIATGKITGSKGAPPSYGNSYPQPRCAAALRLGPVGVESGTSWKGTLDLRRAVATVAQSGNTDTTIRILADRNVVLIRGPKAATLDPITASSLPAAKLGETDGVSWLLMNMPGDADYKGMDYALALATKGDLKAVSLVSSFDIEGGDVLKHAIALAKESIAQPEEGLILEHEKTWSKFWSQSGIELEDKLMQRWWYRLLYYANVVCEPGAAPVGIMPPLATDATPWHADFHHNYNTWQAFWPLPGLNHPDLADPWIAYNNNMIPRYQYLAKETYGIEGIHVPISSFMHEPDPALCKSPNKRQISMMPWGLTIGLQGMTLQSMWQKYLYDQDVSYMKEKIYPFIRETSRFYVSFMEKCKKNNQGKILLGPSYSPEHGPMGIYNCPFDIAYVHYTFDALIEAATTLNTDKELVEKCRKYKALLSDYPTALDNQGKPVIVDWEGCKFREITVHNITVPASPVFPGDQVTWFSSEEEKELLLRTIQATRFNGVNSHVMFNIAKARLSMMDGYTEARKWFASRELPNGFFVWQGHKHGTFMSEMIGIAGLINEFLLQSVQNKIRLFPCWPQDKDAAFTRLRAQGGFIVSAEFKNGKVASARIETVSDKPLQLLSPWETIYVNGKKSAIGPDGLITLQTKPGQVFVFAETDRK